MLKKNKTIICKNLVFCRNFFKKSTGLMFRSRKSVCDTAWIFFFNKPTKVSVTMFFVFFSIDVIFLDSKKKVIGIKTLYPWQTYTFKKEISYFIELEFGAIKKYSIKKGDILKF